MRRLARCSPRARAGSRSAGRCHDRPDHRALREEPSGGAGRSGHRHRSGPLVHPAPQARCDPRSRGPPGDRLHRVDGPQPGPRRRPGHLSDRQRAGRRTQGRRRARLLDVRDVVRARRLPGGDGSLLGAQPRPRVHEFAPGPPPRGSEPGPGTGRLQRRLGLPVHAGGCLRPQRARRAAHVPGLHAPLRDRPGAGSRGSGERRRVPAPVPGHHRSGPAARLRRQRGRGDLQDPRLQCGRRGSRPRVRRPRILRAGPRLHPGPGGHRAHRPAHARTAGSADLGEGRRHRPLRSRHPPRTARACPSGPRREGVDVSADPRGSGVPRVARAGCDGRTRAPARRALSASRSR